MATPPFLRYLPARLKPLSSPAVWAPLAIFTLVSAFIWEYHSNPDLFNRQPIGSLTPDSNLTPEEEARLSEVDNLDVLLDGSRVPSNTEAVTGQITPVPLEDGAEAGSNLPLADRDNPFAEYEAEYQFPGAANRGAAITPQAATNSISTPNANRSSNGSSSSQFNFGNGLLNPTAPSSNSALSDALNRQSAGREATGERGQIPSASTGRQPSSQPDVGNVPGQAVVPSSGTISVPFIRTTPEMSPPVGGTGYQPPATSSLPAFNLPQQQPTTNPYNLPSPAAAPVTPTAPPAAGTAYTPPTFTQPDQGRAINPRR